MKLSFCNQIGLMRFFWSIKPTYKFVNAVCANPSAPTLATFQLRDAQKPRSLISSVCAFLVLNVGCSRNIAEIAERIVSRIAVNVVNIARRPGTSHVKPSKSAGSVPSFVDAYNCVSFWLGVPGNRPRNDFSARFSAPSKDSCFGFVVQQCTQLVKCDVKMAHAISLS